MSRRAEEPPAYVTYASHDIDEDDLLPPVEKTSSRVTFHPVEVEHRLIPNRKEVKNERNQTYIKMTSKTIVHPPPTESLSGSSTPTKGSLKKNSKYDKLGDTKSRKHTPGAAPGPVAGRNRTQGQALHPQQQQRPQNKPQSPQKPPIRLQPQGVGKIQPGTGPVRPKPITTKPAQPGLQQQRGGPGPGTVRPISPVNGVQTGQTPPPNKGQTQTQAQAPIPSVNVPPKKLPQGQTQPQVKPISPNVNRPAQQRPISSLPQQRPMPSPPPNRFNPQQQQPKKPIVPTNNQPPPISQYAQYQSYPRRPSQQPGRPTPGKQHSQTQITVIKMPEKIKDDSIRSVDAQTIDQQVKREVKKSTAKATPDKVRRKSNPKKETDSQPISASTKKINESITSPPPPQASQRTQSPPRPQSSPSPQPVSSNEIISSLPATPKKTNESLPPESKKTNESITLPNNPITDENPKKNSQGSDKVKLVFQLYEVEYDNDPSEIVEEAKKKSKNKKSESAKDYMKEYLLKELFDGSSLLSGLNIGGQNIYPNSAQNVERVADSLSLPFMLGVILCEIEFMPSIPKAIDEGAQDLSKILRRYWGNFAEPDMTPYTRTVGVQTSESHHSVENRSRQGNQGKGQGQEALWYQLRSAKNDVELSAIYKMIREDLLKPIQQPESSEMYDTSELILPYEPEQNEDSNGNRIARVENEVMVKAFGDFFAEKGGTKYIVSLEKIDKHYKDCIRREKTDMSATLLDLLSIGLRHIDDLARIQVSKVDKSFFDLDFIFTLTKACSKFEINLDHQIASLSKVHNYGISMLQKWFKCLDSKTSIDLLTIEEFAPNILADILVHVHSILVLIAQYLVDIVNKLKSKMELTNLITDLLDNLRGFLACITEEIGSVGESCAVIVTQIPNIPQNHVSEVLTRIYKQVNYADMAMSRGMEALIPILSYYLIKEVHLSLPRSSN